MGVYFFPTPYEEELIYSVIARYHLYSGNPACIHTLEDLFESRSETSSIEFQGNIDVLMKNLPLRSKLTSKVIIDKHTLFPYYAAFIPVERAQKAIDIIRNGNLSKVYSMLGLITLGRKNQNLKFLRHCPECMKEDIDSFGETYWHRAHQISSSLTCYKHGSVLLDTQYPAIGANRQEYTLARNIRFSKSSIKLSEDVLQKSGLVNDGILRLLSRKYSYYSPEESRKVLINKFISEGLASMSGMIMQTELQEIVIHFWGEEFLGLIGHHIDIDNPANWFTILVRGKRRTSNPISNILLLKALAIDIDDFLEPREDVEDYKTSLSNMLVKLVDNGDSLRSISKEMKISTNTIKRELSDLKIDYELKYNGGGRHVGMIFTETEVYRNRLKHNKERWLTLIEENPGKNRYELKEMDRVLFRWLLKYDKEWLFKNSQLSSEKFKTIDEMWSIRDRDYIEKIKQVVEEMKCSTSRITISAIGSKLGIKGWLLSGYKKMPMIDIYLKEELETLDKYHMRRIRIAIEEIVSEGNELNKSNLIKLSGVKSKDIIKLEKQVSRILEEMGIF